MDYLEKEISRPIIVVDIIIMSKEKKQFLSYFKNRDNAFELPGGYVLKNKDLLDSIIYYVKKQVNLSIKKNDITIEHIMYYPSGEKLYIIMKTEKFSGNLRNNNAKDYSELKWLNYDNPPLNLHRKLLRSFSEIKEGVMYSEYCKK